MLVNVLRLCHVRGTAYLCEMCGVNWGGYCGVLDTVWLLSGSRLYAQ